MEEFVQSAAENGGHRKQEGDLGRGRAGVAEREARRRGRPRARDAGDQGEGLRETEQQAVAVGEVFFVAGAASEGVGGAEQQTEHDQHDRDEPEVSEGVANDVLEEEAEHADRDRADDDDPAHPGVGVVAWHGAGQRAEPLPDDADDARSVAYRLGMKFYVFNETERFAREVMDRFVAEYCAGHTPNPCIDCNRCLKFGALLDRALVLGYDYIATGHYARVDRDPGTGLYRLLRGRDRRKDQSYVLYQLTQHQLAHLLLPVGNYDKPAIRDSARQAGLLNADKADSQDICFVPDGDYAEFLREYGHVTMEPGDFVDQDGHVLGRHKGLPCYTTGQRKGLGVSAGKHVYVVRKNAADNTILLGDNEDLFTGRLTACRVNWIAGSCR